MNSTQSMLSNRSKYLISFAILGGAIALCVVMIILKEPPEDREIVNLTQTASVVPATNFDDQLNIEVSGVVEPHREVKLSAQVSGEIASKSAVARAGNYVREGDVLLTIDPRDYELEIKRLQAELAQSEAAINELTDELDGLERSRKIVQRDYDLQLQELERRRGAGSALSQSELDQAERNVMGAERTLTELQNSIRLANTRKVRLTSGIDLSRSLLEKAELNLQRTKIEAPFDGIIVSDLVEQGDFVRVGDTLLVYEDTSQVDVKCSLRGSQVLQILKYSVPDSRFDTDPLVSAYQLPPTPVTIIAQSGNDMVEWEGTLQRYDGVGFDEQTKMIPVRVIVNDPVSNWAGRPVPLVRQMFVNVVIALDTAGVEDDVLLTVHEVAIHPGNKIWSLTADDRLQQHSITILDRLNEDAPPQERLVVIRGADGQLKPGSRIVVTPLAQPNPGAPVELEPWQFGKEDSAATPITGTSDDAEPGGPLTTRPGDTEEPASARVEGESKRS